MKRRRYKGAGSDPQVFEAAMRAAELAQAREQEQAAPVEESAAGVRNVSSGYRVPEISLDQVYVDESRPAVDVSHERTTVAFDEGTGAQAAVGRGVPASGRDAALGEDAGAAGVAAPVGAAASAGPEDDFHYFDMPAPDAEQRASQDTAPVASKYASAFARQEQLAAGELPKPDRTASTSRGAFSFYGTSNAPANDEDSQVTGEIAPVEAPEPTMGRHAPGARAVARAEAEEEPAAAPAPAAAPTAAPTAPAASAADPTSAPAPLAANLAPAAPAPAVHPADQTAPTGAHTQAAVARAAAEAASAKPAQKKPEGYRLPRVAPAVPDKTAPVTPVVRTVGASEANGRFLDSFFAELERCGVTDFVLSPSPEAGALCTKALERTGDAYVIGDETSAAHFALGLAKARRRPVAVIGASATAPAKWASAAAQATDARVPLLLLSSASVAAAPSAPAASLAASLRGSFALPAPDVARAALARARQTALDACIAAHGAAPSRPAADAGPVHVSFVFENPLVASARVAADPVNPLPPTVVPGQGILPADARGIFGVFHGKRTVAVVGDDAVSGPDDAAVLLDFARKRRVPLIASAASGMRGTDDPLVIDCYEAILSQGAPQVDVIIRFGRWPESERLKAALTARRPVQVVVDLRESCDDTASTSLFVRALPVVFAAAMREPGLPGIADERACAEWVVANDRAAEGLAARLRGNEPFASNAPVPPDPDAFEAAYVTELLAAAPSDSLLVCGGGLAARTLDAFGRRRAGLPRIMRVGSEGGGSGVLPAALGAAQHFGQTTLLTGDLSLLTDAGALGLQEEMRLRGERGATERPAICVVVLDNGGAGTAELLDARISPAARERLFARPHDADLRYLAQAFAVPYRRASTLEDFRAAYRTFLGQPGISIVDVKLPLSGVRDRFAGIL